MSAHGEPSAVLAPWMSRWRLVADGESFCTRFGSRLAPVHRDGVPAMLKVAGGEEESRGAAVMAWWAGVGAARVLAHEGDAILLERACGERSLAAMSRSGEDAAAMRILCRAAKALHAPRRGRPPSTLVPLERWFQALAPAAESHGGVLRQSLSASRALLAGPVESVVLHGDLHHDNVLDGGDRGWLAIDPKGLIGEPGFDYANMLCNPGIDVAGAEGRLGARVAIASAESGIEPRRLLRWLLAYAGLSAAWTLGVGDDASQALAMAEMAAKALA
jgi:streptomycin 6-kinase